VAKPRHVSRRFADTTAGVFGALTGLMPQPIAIKANSVCAFICKMTQSITAAARMLLTIMTQANKELFKP